MSALDGLRNLNVLEIAVRLGLKTSLRGSSSRGWISPCPACGRERRNGSTAGERRGAIGVTADGHGWRCFPCAASGDALDLVSFQLGGKRFRDLEKSMQRQVFEWFGRDLAFTSPRTREPSPPPSPPVYPPEADVETFWDESAPVTDVLSVRRYLTSRGIDAEAVAERDLARAIRPDRRVPNWARTEGLPWTSTLHLLLLPMFDARGEHRSFAARAVGEARPKSVSPRLYNRAGLVFADEWARQLLSGGRCVSADSTRIVIAEGDVDYLLWATSTSDADESCPATLGIVSGSWTQELANRIPPVTAVIATDSDDAGDRYASRIAESLMSSAVKLERWRPPQASS